MRDRRRAAPRAALALLCALVAMSALTFGARAAGELESRTLTSYDVGADGSVHVSLSAVVTNRDPSTQRRDSGRVFFYSATAFAVHDGATNLVARSGTARLTIENLGDTRDTGDPFRLVVVRFDRDLYYNDSTEIALEYDLAAVRAGQVLVNRQYAFVPAVGQGTQSLVRISAPADRRITIGSANCARTADRPIIYLCGASTSAADYQAGGRCAFTAAAPRWDCAFTGPDFVVVPFEAAAADLALATRTGQAQLAQTAVEVRVDYFAGDEAWAAHVEDLIRRGLPILEEANGYFYPGLPLIEIVESGYRETNGYEGLASTQGRIRLTPVVDDQTVLHEVSHLWSGIFASRWLAEGTADYTANIAARRLGLKAQPVKDPLPATPLLEQWGPLHSQIATTPQERALEEAGYARSLRFLELLAERVGSRTVGAANATLAQGRLKGNARSYLDVMEQISGQSLAPLFVEWALTPEDAQKLPARAAAQTAATRLRERAAAAGLPLPADIERDLRDWQFDDAQRLISMADGALSLHARNSAEAGAGSYTLGTTFRTAFADGAESGERTAREEADALTAVKGADDRLDNPRTLLMRVGLVGTGPDARAAEARAALARGDFPAALSAAAATEERLDAAARNGAIRLALLAGLLLFGATALLLRGRARARDARKVNVLDSAG